MGANLSRRLMRAGHEVVVYDVSADAIAQLESEGATGSRIARGLRREAHAAASGLDHGAGRVRRLDRRRSSPT